MESTAVHAQAHMKEDRADLFNLAYLFVRAGLMLSLCGVEASEFVLVIGGTCCCQEEGSRGFSSLMLSQFEICENSSKKERKE